MNKKQCKDCEKQLENRNKTGFCKNHVKNRRTHGMYGTPTYKSWCGLKGRCNGSNNPKYKNYGGRGIRVCERWNKFENFYEDMGDRPEGMSIDRIDNDGDYEPDNCRWADNKTQGGNKRTVTIYKGKNFSEWDKALGFGRGTVRRRVRISGWSLEKATTTPKFKRGYKTRPENAQ